MVSILDGGKPSEFDLALQILAIRKGKGAGFYVFYTPLAPRR
jgi:hypothetical protein